MTSSASSNQTIPHQINQWNLIWESIRCGSCGGRMKQVYHYRGACNPDRIEGAYQYKCQEDNSYHVIPIDFISRLRKFGTTSFWFQWELEQANIKIVKSTNAQ